MTLISSRRRFIAGAGGTVAAGLLPGIGMAQGGGVSIDIGTMAAGSAWYQYGIQFSQYMKPALPEGSVINVRPYAAADGNLMLIEADDRIQLGLTFSVNLRWAHARMTDVTPATADNVRVLFGGIDRYYVAPMVLEGFGMDTLSEAIAAERPLRISTLQAGSLGDITTGLLLRAHGIDEATLRGWGGSINRVALQAASEALVTNRADVWINPITATHPRAQELSFSHPLRFLGLSDAAMAEMEALGYVPNELPGGAYPSQAEPVMLPGTVTIAIVHKDMPDEIAYALTSSVIDNLATLKEENAGLDDFDLALAATPAMTGDTPLHPGAERAFRDAGIDI